jgi:hypothetical protein
MNEILREVLAVCRFDTPARSRDVGRNPEREVDRSFSPATIFILTHSRILLMKNRMQITGPTLTKKTARIDVLLFRYARISSRTIDQPRTTAL